MSLETMAFIFGGLLLGAGLFGGGLEIKELKLPQITGIARVICGIAGICFVALAVSLNLKLLHTDEPEQLHEPTQTTKTFLTPTYNGMRLDACFEWAKRCGEEPATAWCRTQGFTRATEYQIENVGERGISTKLIGTQQVCSGNFCDSFVQITCQR